MKRSIRLRIGTRPSPLALVQADEIRDKLIKEYPEIDGEIIKIRTRGDDKRFSGSRGKGIFLKELEEALIDGRIDLAVHSMKDVTLKINEDLTIAAITEREDSHDGLVSRFKGLMELPSGSKVGTSSLRRKAQVLNTRKDLRVEDIRGNINTRLEKLDKGLYDGIVLAIAGLKRLGMVERVSQILSFDACLPAAGQGALAIETRIYDERVNELVEVLNHPQSFYAVSAERAFLSALGGDEACGLPAACYGELEGDALRLEGMVGSPDGEKLIRAKLEGKITDYHIVGEQLAEKILKEGGKEVIESLR